jgi:Yippee zinc-binding/DNA-binding /Mis18, centromere assembly
MKVGRNVNRELLTGQHVVADVSCTICGTVLGWKYVDAKEASQKYKIGKFILEMKRVVLGVGWEDVGVVGSAEGDGVDDLEGMREVKEGEEVVVFDSEDEDECEDLFAGVWDAEVVAKRRARRVGRKKDS